MSTSVIKPSSNFVSEIEEENVAQLRDWVENEADFYGNIDENFLLWFARGCKYDLEKSKKKMSKYYENRTNLPQWWANFDLNDETMQTILKSNIPRRSINLDDLLKVHAAMVNIFCIRQNGQLNGFIFIADWRNLPFWIIPQILSPMLLKNIAQSILFSTPVKLKRVYFVNCPMYAYTAWAIIKPFMPQKMRNRVHLFRNDWKALFDIIPLDQIPDEYGGSAGPIAKYEESNFNEMMSFADYIREDNKYGFK